MKLIELINVSDKQINITQVRGLCLSPGETIKVQPATALHPAVSPYIPKILRIKEDGDAVLATTTEVPKKVEPTAPAKMVSKKDVSKEKPVETIVEPIADMVTQDADSIETSSEESLREVYLSVPGITETNIDAVLESFSTPKSLSEASKEDLMNVGIAKNKCIRVISWAKTQV